jgi:hypothetical protein
MAIMWVPTEYGSQANKKTKDKNTAQKLNCAVFLLKYDILDGKISGSALFQFILEKINKFY